MSGDLTAEDAAGADAARSVAEPGGLRRRITLVATAVTVVVVVAVTGWAMWGGLSGSAPSAGGPAGSAGSGGASAPAKAGATFGSGPSGSGPSGSGPSGSSSKAGGSGNGRSGNATPTGDEPAGFLTELGAIDPALVADPNRAVQAGRDTCQDIKANRPADTIVQAAIQRFTVPTVAITATTASLLVDASRNHLCPR